MTLHAALRPWAGTILFLLVPAAAHAVLDIDDRGPLLEGGNFAMRVTNAGIIGNAFFDVGLSSDPSFEFPRYSGQECVNSAELWVGALDQNGERRVSGGPMLEWRPTPAADDRVRPAWHGRLGSRRFVDDDGDGRVDEEVLNGKDDDGDGEVDEDLGFDCQQMLAADYVDDRPEAVNFVYSTSENHHPLGLSVHQEAYSWAAPGYDGIAGLQFHITNHGTRTLRQLYVGVLADLDSRLRNDRTGHLDDRVIWRTFSRDIDEGTSVIEVGGRPPFAWSCMTHLEQTLPVLVDGDPRSGLPAVTLIPLDHTTDPLGFIDPVRFLARAPTRVSFRSAVFLRGRIPGQGGPPGVDADRYAALAGEFPASLTEQKGDYAVLVSCGPFASLGPGQSIDFAAALVAATNVDSLDAAASNALFVHHGSRVNLLPDSTGPLARQWQVGNTGLNGHEVCLEPPPHSSFYWDPHCAQKFDEGRVCPTLDCAPPELPEVYSPGHCIWTDADCDACTGFNGNETIARWLDPGAMPPAPGVRVTPLDHAIRIGWDNLPEVLLRAGVAGRPGARFVGYRVYKLARWTGRVSLLPPRENWALLAAFGPDTANSEKSLAAITDSSVDYVRILYDQRQYPAGRYSVVDPDVLDGFDYVYAVTTVTQIERGPLVQRYESPRVASFDQAVRPRAAARDKGTGVWVVPNPFRARAAWDLPPVDGNRLTRHLDFMGLPRTRCLIKVWTLAGDFVARIDHDGSGGDGQAAWDLVSRNGQEVESGVYLFTVESALGHQIGRFVVIR